MQNDFLVIDHGSIVAIRPLTDEAAQWLDANVAAESWQWLGGSLCIDRRYAAPLIEGIEADGFDVGHAWGALHPGPADRRRRLGEAAMVETLENMKDPP